MKATLKILAPYFLIVIILTTVILSGLAIMNRGATKRLAEKKSRSGWAIKKTDRADGRKKSHRKGHEKLSKKPVGDIVLAAAEDQGILGPPAPVAASTSSQTVEAAPQLAAVPAPEPNPTPATPEPQPNPAPAEQPKATPSPLPEPAPAPQPNPTPVASAPLPETPLAPIAVIASNAVLTADQALSLQWLYPGISEGWTIEQYLKAQDDFYARYEKWGGATEDASAAFQEFLSALSGEKIKVLSFPRSWLVMWNEGKLTLTAKTAQTDQAPRAWWHLF